jgi:rhamnose transport system substrate-binding protein
MRRVRLSLAGAVAAAALSIAGCGSSSSSPSSSASASSGGAAATSSSVSADTSSASCTKHFTVGLIPKETSDPFFVAADKGAQEAAKQLNMQLIYKGPDSLDPAGQTQIISQMTNQHLNAITVSADDPNALVPALKQAANAGIKITAWNADVAKSARAFFMDNPPPTNLVKTITDQMVQSVGASAKILVMTSTLQAPNQNLLLTDLKAYVAKAYPHLTIEKILPGNSDTSYSEGVAKSWLQAHPETKGILTVDGAELAGAAQAVDSLGMKGKVALVGIGVPSQNGHDLLTGTVKAVVLWNPIDLGYATMYMVHAQLCGQLHAGQKSLAAGRLGNLGFESPDSITLGKTLVFTKENVGNYHF